MNLEKFFDKKIENLQNLGFSKSIFSKFLFDRKEILEKAEKTDSENVPFVFVFPINYLGLHGMLDKIRYKNNKGKTSLKPCDITDTIEIPKEPYCIFDVDNGSNTVNMTFKETESLINGRGRRGLTVMEMLSLAIQEGIPSSYTIACLKSLYAKEHFGSKVIMILFLCFNEPSLYHTYYKQTPNLIVEQREIGTTYGCPSCKV